MLISPAISSPSGDWLDELKARSLDPGDVVDKAPSDGPG